MDNAKTYGIFYVVVVQSIFIFRLETWVVRTCILKALEMLHNHVVRWISSRVSPVV